MQQLHFLLLVTVARAGYWRRLFQENNKQSVINHKQITREPQTYFELHRTNMNFFVPANGAKYLGRNVSLFSGGENNPLCNLSKVDGYERLES